MQPSWHICTPTAGLGKPTRFADPKQDALQREHLPAWFEAVMADMNVYATLAEWVECPAGVVAQLMGRKPSATAERHYRARPLDLLRLWHTKIETWMLGQAGVQFAANAEPDKPDVMAGMNAK